MVLRAIDSMTMSAPGPEKALAVLNQPFPCVLLTDPTFRRGQAGISPNACGNRSQGIVIVVASPKDRAAEFQCSEPLVRHPYDRDEKIPTLKAILECSAPVVAMDEGIQLVLSQRWSNLTC